MSIKQMIAKKTQCNFRLNRKVLHLKHCWDEVSRLLEIACARRHPAPPPPPPPKQRKPSPCDILCSAIKIPPPPKPPCTKKPPPDQ